MRSIRSFLLTRLLGGAALVLACAGLVVYVVVERSLEAEYDRNLTDRVLGFASILFQEGDQVEFEFSDQLMPEYGREEEPAFFELWFHDGRLIERSDSLQGGDLAIPVSPSFEPAHWSARLPDGRDGRFVARLVEVHHVYPEEGPGRPRAAVVLVVVARGLEDLEAAQLTVLLSCIAAALVLVGLMAFLSWRAVEKGLEPTRRLAARLDAIEVDDLPERLGMGELPAELAPVAEKTDALIRRVDAALKRERRTTADIAHELRTPISELLTVSEVALRNGRDPESTAAALRTARDVAWRMGRSVSTLLKLARIEMGAETFDRARVDLGQLVDELLRPLGAIQRERRQTVSNRVAAGEEVEGDAEVLRIVLSNLLGNALYYSPPGATVDCRLERSGASWRLLVENEADDLSREDLDALSEPFWRKDGARADRDRSGLGLALSRALVEKTGLALTFELENGRFRAVLAG